MRTLNAVILITAVVGGVCGCRSTPPAAVSEKVMACGSIQDETERYRCYDGLNASMRPAPAGRVAAANAAPAPAAPAPVVAAPASAVVAPAAPAAIPTTARAPKAAAAPAAKATAASDDRVGEEYLAPKDRRSVQAPTAVHSSIASVDEVRPSQYVIKLANGQVWRHTGVQTMTFFRVGDDVNIEREMLGSYHMWSKATGGNTNWVRVTRVE
ncbi:MAG TPA: hypothetical protein VGM84_20955 [Steroidobacteraceae bacterium]|jgi:hypothetical protein